MKYFIDISGTLALAFGQRLNLYKVKKDLLTPHEKKQQPITIDVSDAAGDGNGLLGLPIFQQVVFTDPQETTGKQLYLGDCLVDVNLPRQIIKTPVVGQDGTVKEFISNGDYNISIKGLFINQAHPDRLPEIQMREALRWFTKGRALGVESKVFDVFGIHNIVVESFNMPQVPTFIGMRPFELRCLSDTEYTIDLDNNV